MTTDIEIPEGEPWLAAFVRPEDTSIDAARTRARKATAGEVIRRDRDRTAPPLAVRQVTPRGGTTATTTTRVALDPSGQPMVKTVKTEPS